MLVNKYSPIVTYFNIMINKKISLLVSTIERIKGHKTSPLITNLGITLNLPSRGIYYLLRVNTPNGLLTTVAALSIIGEALDTPMAELINTDIFL